MALGWLWWRAWPVLVAGDAAAFCVAGVANEDIHLRFTWQAWHLGTSTFVLRGRRGTYGTGLVLVARLGPVLVAGDAAALCVAGRGTWGHPPSFHVAGVALGDIHLRVLRGRRGTYGTGLVLVARLGPFWSPVTPRHFAWQAWHLGTSTFVSRSRRGTWRQPPLFCVAGVALVALGWLWWRAWARFGRR